ncbi:1-deoxy-D-xylulose-5-phosphate synthase [Clostridium tepidiprofundi DSM 19306]|uniref:1-deoxy-D-xylulose-5-phosphate synthase n=1 Tax=Clostridium tepidiprofundi DSM 19306 TaxID=1121338 RepID=A0A151B7D2_9CLOT|nr:1-deoxy-D-xylulose-5-phosphate synthase [Clostridium tepidiprofundi]KYH35700.1 1-deoxy-D-xylulose-5-phosphate synthase [Clostridium tepidiprofundi DSM 19306]
MKNIIDNFNGPHDVNSMNVNELELFAAEIRQFLIDKVSKTGGHLASNLGVVELTLSLLKVFNMEKDKLIWDVGHQAYVYKILTGRKEQFDTLRCFGGLSGFLKREESKYDQFEAGHSSTSLSAGLGFALARDLKKENYEVISIIGDGALTGGMALEALNDIGYRKTKIVIVLNDNNMSIAENVGGISTYLSKLRVGPKYNKIKNDVNSTLMKIPTVGKGVADSIHRIKNGLKQIVVEKMFFEDIGIKYIGPIDGHNIREMTDVLSMVKNIDGPVLIHTITKKGKGYEFAEKNPNKFHGIGPFDCSSGKVTVSSKNSYSKAFGEEMVRLGEKHKNLVAITAAMPDGTGLNKFSKIYKNRFFDVGIAEQHAVTLAAGMASQGLKPVFAVYSTFLQRAYDQVLHDVCMQNLPVIFAIDRAGIVGEDGETHQGVFDLSYLSHMPNMTILAPKCIDELKTMLNWAVVQDYPIAIRYPRGGDNLNVSLSPLKNFKLGKWEVLYGEGNITLIATGKMVQVAVLVKEKLETMNIQASVINAWSIKPIDKSMIKEIVSKGKTIVTLEDNVIRGGFGSQVLEYVNTINDSCKVINLGFNDEFIPHGKVDLLFKVYELDVQGIVRKIISNLS